MHAVVIGASFAGLLSARVLSDVADAVTVVDRDRLPDRPEQRRGVPQGHHLHILLQRGREVCDELFPGFTDDAVALGVPVVCSSRDARIYRRWGFARRFESHLRSLQLSRPVLDQLVSARVRDLPNVTIRTGRVAGLHGDAGRVRGVLLDDEREPLLADLVVDAGGRGSATPRWLEEIGVAPPAETVVNAHWGYSSRFVRFPDSFRPGFRMVGGPPAPGVPGTHGSRGAGLMELEDGLWVLTVMGNGGDLPPTDEPGLAAFVASLPYDDVAKALAEASWLSPVVPSRSLTNRMRHYERHEALPEGLVLMGDAVCALNPSYGQGLTVAALQALDLRTELHTGLDGIAGRFAPRAFEAAAFAWAMATGGDYKVAGVVGPPQTEAALARAPLAARLEALSSEDDDVMLRFLETQHMLRTPEWMADPQLLGRVIADWKRLGDLVGAPDVPPPAL